ncbi:hypothetical protein Pth03_36640 [Planotetraspora thailandica]|uniref:Limonene hydroxylase n=1 Tax=Planotetraspora thailandica TaxID=487172 RepID=A0A8J3VD03_9ACTN|nr:hypothetical protein [Planotetraspora thailandica]GII55275.1 hypothetical protein Pth03_36640 [Planotetraspora thailandica]
MKPGVWKLDDGPVGDRPTFLAHALAMSVRYGPGPWPEEASRLPDELPRPESGPPYISSVVMDGIRTHHFARGDDPGGVAEMAGLLQTLVTAAPQHDDLVRLHDLAAEHSALAVADELVAELRRRKLPAGRVHAIGRHLAEQGTRREAVKIGLVMVGACGGESDRDLLLLLGTLEELTLFAVVALIRTQPDGQRAVYGLARRVRDWGRIHAVERLKGCDDPEVKDWLLREGFRNGIMNEYLVHIAATTGGLRSALARPDVDEGLLSGAGGILAGLANGGPARDMTDYADAVPVLHRYADLAAERPPVLGRLIALLHVRAFLIDPIGELDWQEGARDRLRARYEALVAEPRWRELVLTHLADSEREDFTAGLWPAMRLALPVAEQVIAYLRRDPLDAYAWMVLAEGCTAEDVERTARLAENLLPLELLTGEPVDGVLWGADFAPDNALESVVGRLARFPGVGLSLIRIGLSARSVRSRRAALKALAGWPAAAVPEEAVDWVLAAAMAEPSEDLRQEMADFVRTR